MVLKERTLRYLMFIQGKTQDRLAADANISRATINAICNGRSCRAETAAKIAAALGVTVEKLTCKGR